VTGAVLRLGFATGRPAAGRAERFIQTLKRRWAYRYAYRTSAIPAASLRPWLDYYINTDPIGPSASELRWTGSGKPVHKLLRSHS
jgi:hypothetical protein